MGTISYGKLVIIGAGNVGSAILNSVLRMNILDDIVVVNRNQKKALGEVLDASHTTAFAYSANANIRVGGYEECADAQIIVITAGPSITPGNSRDRMVLLEKNVDVMNNIMEQITRYTKDAIIIVVSNPLDILTYIAQKKFDYPANKIFGTGTLLYPAEFLFRISCSEQELCWIQLDLTRCWVICVVWMLKMLPDLCWESMDRPPLFHGTQLILLGFRSMNSKSSLN